MLHQIGIGVQGPVFRTYEPDGDRLVALKAFHLDLTPEQSQTLADRLRGIAGRGLVHPALVTPLDAGVSDGVPYLAAEYVAAESLDVAIRHHAPAPVDTALPLIVQLADAVDTAHAHGLTHGALHLRDVFVTPELARMTGFGVVPALERVGVRGPLRRPYAAPEQMSSGAWGPAADRYALAAIVYELLTGRRATGSGGHLTERLAPVAGARGAQRLVRLFESALALEPTARPASSRLFADQLADAVGWTGAEGAREALATMALHESTHRSGAGQSGFSSSVSGGMTVGTVEDHQGRGALPAGGEVTQVEGAGMANNNRPGNTTNSEFDWSERRLDRGESDEVREPTAYTPRPIGPPAGFERPAAVKGGVPAGYPHDGADLDLDRFSDEWEDATVTPSADDLLDQALPLTANRQQAARGPEESWDLPLSAALAQDVGRSMPAARVGQASAQPRVAAASTSPRAPIVDDDGGVYDGEDDGYHAVASGAPAPAAAYEPIDLRDLSDRLGAGRGATDDEHDAHDIDEIDEMDEEIDDDDDEAFDASLDAGSALRTPAAISLPLDLDEPYDDEFAGDEEDDDEYETSSASGSRRLPVTPLVLLALAIAGGAFAIGFGWLSGGVGAGGQSADLRLAAGLESPAALPAPGAPEETAELAYSEATVTEAAAPAAPSPTEPAAPPPEVVAAEPAAAPSDAPEPPAPIAA
ncbi:MAG: protein kinase, partial [Acidobacteria bacterium]|nr:protein kinase [Acidobacteriota bacterium]